MVSVRGWMSMWVPCWTLEAPAAGMAAIVAGVPATAGALLHGRLQDQQQWR